MSVVNAQDFWLAGARAYFKRDAISGVAQPTVDLGVVKQATPNITSEKVTLKDADGGVKRIVDESQTELTESYDVELNNFAPGNLSLMFRGSLPEEFTQSAAEAAVAHTVHLGHLLKILDSSGVKVYNLRGVSGLYKGTVENEVIESITVSTKTIKLTGDQTAEAGLGAGKQIIVRRSGLANLANQGTYTVVSATLNAGKTDVVVAETPAANEVAITGVLTMEDAGTIYGSDDWEVVNLARGLIRIKSAASGGDITDLDSITVVYDTTALSGKRMVKPQATTTEIEGELTLIFGRESNAAQTVRECRVSIVTTAASISADDYSSFTLQMTVLTDPTSTTQPAGRLLQFIGTMPTDS